MRSFALLASLAALTTACATTPPPAPSEIAEVVGRLENLSYESNGDPDDLLGHGTITARLHVSRIIDGRLSGRVIDVRYFEHTYLNDQKPVRFRIKRMAEGHYIVCTPPGMTGFKCRS
jgi:integration host factor subunit beta